jgi:hypothetical protein
VTLKTFGKKMGTFAFFLLVILILLNRWMGQSVTIHYDLQYEEAVRPRINAPIIIIGSSHATHGINPKYLEDKRFSVYNFALNGGNPVFYLKWYHRILTRYYRRPSHVIYAVDWFMFDDHLLQRQFEHDSKYFPLPLLMAELKESRALKTLVLNRFSLIRERKKLPVLLFKKRKAQDIYPIKKYYNGFVPYESKGNLWKTKEVNVSHSEQQFEAFEEILDQFKRDNIKVIFVQIPEYISGRHSAGYLKNMEKLDEVARDRNIPFLDYNREKISAINYDTRYYSDWGHLNEKGSETFSRLLKEDLGRILN